MKILITGAAGLYGSHLTELLIKSGMEVVGIDNFSREFLNTLEKYVPENIINMDFADITPEWADKRKFDIVVHLAASVSVTESMDNPMKYLENNEIASINLCKTLLKTKTKPVLIFASSAKVYGNAEYSPMDENHPLKPESAYSTGKLAVEKQCKIMSEQGYPVVVMRNFNTYGENQNLWGYSAVIPAFIQNALKNRSLVIEGDGKQTRDFMYVGDAVEAYKLVIENMEKVKGQTFNIGTGINTTINELAEKIRSLVNSGSDIIHVKSRVGDLPALCADARKIYQCIGWKPKVSLEDGLKRTINWYREVLKVEHDFHFIEPYGSW